MHACMLGHPSAGSRLPLREKKRKQLMKNYTYVQARMHAEHPSAGSRLHLTEKCKKIKKDKKFKIRHVCMHACMHAGASLSWKPVAPEGKMRN